MKCLLLEDANVRNLVIALVTGLLFFTGWWILIDVACTHPEIMSKNILYFLPGLCGTVSMIIILIIPYRTGEDNYFYSTTKCPLFITHAILFLTLVLLFGSFIWAIYIWIADFLVTQRPVWPGVGIMLQNLFILISALQMKFARLYQDVI